MYKSLTVFVLGGLTLAANAHTVTNLLVHSTKMDKDVPVTIVLPDGYVKGDVEIPVIEVILK